METNRAIQQVYTQTTGSDWQICLTAWQQGGLLPLSDVLVNVVLLTIEKIWDQLKYYSSLMKKDGH